jgi:hypothetical protein
MDSNSHTELRKNLCLFSQYFLSVYADTTGKIDLFCFRRDNFRAWWDVACRPQPRHVSQEPQIHRRHFVDFFS